MNILDNGIHLAHTMSFDELDRCLDLITYNGAKTLNVEDQYGIEEGKPANFLVLDADTPFEAELENELVRAVVVPRDQIPKDVVTMNSRVIFENETTGKQLDIKLVYPREADIDAGKISVVVPVGTALLGLRVGQSIDWALPSGESHRYRVVGVPYQPEAAGVSD